jgi:predicted nucleic acid-binding protein
VNVVDSSAWLEYLSDGPRAGDFARPIEATATLIVPVICLYEVCKRVLQQRGVDEALQAVAIMEQGQVVDLDAATAIAAAEISVRLTLPMADSMILAITRRRAATLWTQDADFEGLENVRYFSRVP